MVSVNQTRTTNRSYAKLNTIVNSSDNFVFQKNPERNSLALENNHDLTFQEEKEKGNIISRSQNSINDMIAE